MGRLLVGLYHPKLTLGVQVVSGVLFDGKSDAHRVRLVEIADAKAVAIASLEDLIADRMGQYASTDRGVLEMMDQAVIFYRLAKGMDEAYLDKRIREETGGRLGLVDLRKQLA